MGNVDQVLKTITHSGVAGGVAGGLLGNALTSRKLGGLALDSQLVAQLDREVEAL